jgi:hypothetical protein
MDSGKLPDRGALERRVSELASEGRGILSIIKSIKVPSGSSSKFAKLGDDPLYRTAIRRLRDDGIKLASYAEAWSLLFGREDRDEMLGRNGCSWDDARNRVDLGAQ